METEIIKQALAATTAAKIVVDLIKMGVKLPRWGPPLLAFVAGTITVALFQTAAKASLDPPTVALTILAGVLAAGNAVGVTTLQDRKLPTSTITQPGDSQ